MKLTKSFKIVNVRSRRMGHGQYPPMLELDLIPSSEEFVRSDRISLIAWDEAYIESVQAMEWFTLDCLGMFLDVTLEYTDTRNSGCVKMTSASAVKELFSHYHEGIVAYFEDEYYDEPVARSAPTYYFVFPLTDAEYSEIEKLEGGIYEDGSPWFTVTIGNAYQGEEQ